MVAIRALFAASIAVDRGRVGGAVRGVVAAPAGSSSLQGGRDRRARSESATRLGSSQKCGFGSPSTVDRRDAVAEDEPRRAALAGGVDQLVEEVVEAGAVRHDEVGVGQRRRILGLRLVVLGPDAGRDDRVDRRRGRPPTLRTMSAKTVVVATTLMRPGADSVGSGARVAARRHDEHADGERPRRPS